MNNSIITGIVTGVLAGIAYGVMMCEFSQESPRTRLCDETDEAVILKSEGWRARTSIDLPWIVDAGSKGVLEFKERPTLECYEPLHPDKKVAANQFWWRVKVKKSGAADVSRLEQRAT